jgi:uncharacterized repeat protein (TIGR04042 family)
MPEMHFRVSWPNGTSETCYSPSLVIKGYLAVGQSYLLSEFLMRSRTALKIASDRVKAKYGHPCGRALAQLARIEATSQLFFDLPDACVAIEAFEESHSNNED